MGRTKLPKAEISVLDALDDPALFATAFPRQTWQPWRAFLGACFALGLDGEALEVYRAHTGRQEAPTTAAKEIWCCAGRRAGKSRIAALVAVYLACFRDYRRVLAPGERITIPVIAADRRQARVVMAYIGGLLDSVPMLARMVETRTSESLQLTNRVTIEIHTCSWRGLRGYTVGAAVLDEVAVWRSEDSANPDHEIVNALRPAMATVPGSLLLAISSPYARRGVLWEAYRRHFGKDGDPVLVWQADTRSMNATVPEEVIARAYEQDEAAAAAEYGALFRRDIESFVQREAVEACTISGRLEVPPALGVRYFGFCDPSGGSADDMTLAVSHSDNGVAVLDCVRAVKPPFSPDEVTRQFAETLRAYGITSVTGDRYGGEWPRERFAAHGVHYEPAEKPKSDLYQGLLPLLNSQRCELLDHPKLAAQFLGLERRTARGGRDSIDHGPGGHDDVANAACGALLLAGVQAVGEPWGARLSPTPTRRVIDGETREPYWPSATGFDADPLHDRDYDDLRSELRRNGW